MCLKQGYSLVYLGHDTFRAIYANNFSNNTNNNKKKNCSIAIRNLFEVQFK